MIAQAEAEGRTEPADRAEAAERWRALIAQAEAERRTKRPDREAVAAAKPSQAGSVARLPWEMDVVAKLPRAVEKVAEAAESEEDTVQRKARLRGWAVQKHERDLLEAQEQQRQRIAWLEDQRTKAESALPLPLEEARIQVSRLKALGGSAMLDGVLVSDRAEILYIRCRKRHDLASDTERTGDGGGAFVGAVVGFFAGLLAGPVGAVVGAGIGAGVGLAEKGGSEKKDWAELLTTLQVLAARPL